MHRPWSAASPASKRPAWSAGNPHPPIDAQRSSGATEASLTLRYKVETAWAELERLTVGSLSPQRRNEALTMLADLEANLEVPAIGDP